MGQFSVYIYKKEIMVTTFKSKHPIRFIYNHYLKSLIQTLL